MPLPDEPEHRAWLLEPPGPASPASFDVVEADDLLGIGAGSAILVADDDASNRVAYEAALAPLGRDVVLVGSGVEALATLLDQDVALILLDVQMPVMDGVQTLQFLRKEPRTANTPIIMVTTIGRDHDKHLLTQGGATAVLHKPIHALELNRLVRQLLKE